LEKFVKHLTWLALLAGAVAVAEPPTESAPITAADTPVVDMAVLEVETGESIESTNSTLAAPLKRITDELDRTLELQLAPPDESPEAEGDYVASLR
jgi:hypothetical protein